MPHALVLEKISLLLALNGMLVETQHIPGAANQQADMLSRWDGIATLPPQFQAINRVHFTLESLWQVKAQFHVYPPGSTISWLRYLPEHTRTRGIECVFKCIPELFGENLVTGLQLTCAISGS